MRHTTVSAILLATFTVACATAPGKNFDTSRPLKIEGGSYRQGEQIIQLPELEEKLEAHPAARPQMGGYQAKKWTGMILGSAGGALVGWNLGTNLTTSGTKTWTPALVGAGAIALAIPFALMADGQLRSAAEAYNGSFAQPQSKVLGGAVPFLAIVPESNGRKQCLAGFTMSF
ncbi:hypothetical protein ATI61_101182 [Archangium gephyra]|uniref:Lipoprotein n=1 Tax=Archangium gephyra TaxID=48 RepID=A0AAC8THN9_9BACT|nr:hypothetical protein [Archangium gephyra]AKJ04741.1 Hypothetical protein AA314_06367 [Archangium gephyra]REG37204.1 hypothetical protein ATI61_101182 [Archangium gephyra]